MHTIFWYDTIVIEHLTLHTLGGCSTSRPPWRFKAYNRLMTWTKHMTDGLTRVTSNSHFNRQLSHTWGAGAYSVTKYRQVSIDWEPVDDFPSASNTQYATLTCKKSWLSHDVSRGHRSLFWIIACFIILIIFRWNKRHQNKIDGKNLFWSMKVITNVVCFCICLCFTKT